MTITAGGRVVVEHLSFVAESGKVTCLEGIDADGSMVVARALLGLWPVSGGYVTLCGEVVTPQSAWWLRRLTAYVPRELPDVLAARSSNGSMRQGGVETKRVVVVEWSDERAMPELQRMAESGLAVVIVHGSKVKG